MFKAIKKYNLSTTYSKTKTLMVFKSKMTIPQSSIATYINKYSQT